MGAELVLSHRQPHCRTAAGVLLPGSATGRAWTRLILICQSVAHRGGGCAAEEFEGEARMDKNFVRVISQCSTRR